MAADHDHHHHAPVSFRHVRIDDAALALIRTTRSALGDLLADIREAPAEGEEHDEATREALGKAHAAADEDALWVLGYHAAGDKCLVCGEATSALFDDVFAEGTLPWAAFVSGLPVHPQAACLAAVDEALPDRSPRGIDRRRRELMVDLDRPSPAMATFFRTDTLAHASFDLEDWANSVAEANPKMARSMARDIERQLHWVHDALYHQH